MADTGQRVGDYEVIAQLGAGGMGRVYKVRNVISNREEAMKILLPDFASDPDLGARFMAEIRTLAGLEHPGIAQLRTAFQYSNQFVMVMEYVEGTTLEKLASEMRLPLDHILDYSMQVLAALNYAHGKGVTHRDIKPANIMITTHGVVKLMDFGIAKSSGDMQLTRPGSTMGSVYYMSPEQVRGDTVDGRSDLYSFGVTLYEMLTGRKPFVADTSYSVLNAQLNEPPTPPVELNPAIPPELNKTVLRAMAKRPEDRFQTAEEFRNALRTVREPETAAVPQVAAPVTPNPAQGQAAASVWQYGSPQASVTEPSYAAPEPPAFTPVPPVPVPASRAAKPNRGLWIGLGAVTAILALAAIAWFLPRVLSTNASQKSSVATDGSTPAPQASTTPQEPPSATPQQPPAATPQPTPDNTGPKPQPPVQGPAVPTAPHRGKESAQTPHGGQDQPRQPYVPPAATQPVAGGAGPAGGVPAGPSPADLRAAHDRLMNLEARASSAFAGVDQLRSQQQAQGLDVRGDILAATSRLHQQLNEVRRALNERDLETANDYMNRAEEETARLEKFLGR